MEKVDILSISPVCPYDNISHAGGKTYNYYLKQLSKSFKVSALLFCPLVEKDKCDLKQYDINHKLIFTSGSFLINIEHMFWDMIGALLFRNNMYSIFKYRKIIKYLDILKKEEAFPDVIELEWTNFVYYAKKIRQRYPDVKIIASEHDVNFQSLERKNIRNRKLQRLKSQELDSLKCCDIVLVQSEKDKILLKNEGILNSNILVISPYYHKMNIKNRMSNNRDILFWGAMYRPENYEAAIWFIKKVMPLLENKDIRFIVAGNRPPQELKQYESDRIIVTGFVEDEKPLFENSMCFVSPLLTGAGIKVKVIEALCSGIPVLTNSIGIEGIPAKDKIEYLHCESAEQYAETIIRIQSGKINKRELYLNQKKFMDGNFNIENSLKEYIDKIEGLKGE